MHAPNSPQLTRSPLTKTILQAREGCPAAFELIYRKHRQHVYALCTRMLRDPVEAEDLAQETFLLVLRKIHTFRGEAAFSSWLYRLTTNAVLMSFRRKGPALASLEQLASDPESAGLADVAGPDLRLSGLFDRLNLQAAVKLLPSNCKATFILHDVEGYNHREVATMLGCSVGGSKSQLHRAHKRLRELLCYGSYDETLQRREARRNPSRAVT